jgi:hypothetical protein
MTRKLLDEYTDRQIVDMLQDDTVWNIARRQFSSGAARIQQASEQARSLSPIELRRMEFDAVRLIAAALGVALDQLKERVK